MISKFDFVENKVVAGTDSAEFKLLTMTDNEIVITVFPKSRNIMDLLYEAFCEHSEIMCVLPVGKQRGVVVSIDNLATVDGVESRVSLMALGRSPFWPAIADL